MVSVRSGNTTRLYERVFHMAVASQRAAQIRMQTLRGDARRLIYHDAEGAFLQKIRDQPRSVTN